MFDRVVLFVAGYNKHRVGQFVAAADEGILRASPGAGEDRT